MLFLLWLEYLKINKQQNNKTTKNKQQNNGKKQRLQGNFLSR